nr:hypothetical protein [Deltaproteobacteria bacterium]
MSGRSLLPVLYDPSPGSLMPPGWRRWLFAEVTPDGLFPSEQKSIYAPPPAVHTGARPARGGEIRNLYDDRPELAAELRERLVTWTDHGALAPPPTSHADRRGAAWSSPRCSTRCTRLARAALG